MYWCENTFGGREVEAFTPGTSMASVYADTRSAVGHIETYADSIGYKIKGFTREVFKIIGFGGAYCRYDSKCRS